MARSVQVDAGPIRFVQNIRVGPHSLQGDESVDVGGSDAGASPHELLLAALGTCASTTVRMYAEGNNGRLTVYALNCHMPKRTLLPLGAAPAEMRMKLKWIFHSWVILPTSNERGYYRLPGSVRFIAS